MTGAERVATLRAFHRALEREAHVLRDRPGLAWTQLFNRMQWHGPPVEGALAAAFLERTQPGRIPWLHLRTRPRESDALVRTFTGHEGSVEACALARDDTLLLSGGIDGTLRFWDTATGMLRHTASGHRGPIHACAASTSAGLVATVGEDGTARIWHLDTGAARATLGVHRGPVRGVAFTPAGDRLLTADDSGRVTLWDLATARRIRRFHADLPLWAVAVSPDGRLVAAAGKGRAVQVWNLDDGTTVTTLEAGHDARGCRFTPDGRDLILAWSKNDLTIIDLATGAQRSGFSARTREHHRFYWGVSGHRGPRGMDVAPDGALVVTAAPDNTLRLWRRDGGEEAGFLVGHADVIRCAAFGARGRLVASGGEDGTLRLWDLDRLAGQERVAHGDPVCGCAWSPDGGTVLALWRDRTAALLDPETLAERRRLGGGDMFTCALSPDGRLVATSFMGISINIHDLAAGRIVATLEEQGADPSTAWIHACCFDARGRRLISANEDGTLSVWDVAGATKLGSLEGHRAAVTSCVADPAGSRIASSGRDGTAALWDLDRCRPLGAMEAGVELLDCALSPDGGLLVAGGADGGVRAWEVGTGRLHWTRHPHVGKVTGCQVSPDGRLVYSVGADKTVHALLADTGEPLASAVLPGELSALAVHPFRPEIICGDEGGGLNRLELRGRGYGPIVHPRTREPAEVRLPTIRRRVDFPPDALTAIQFLAAAVPVGLGLLDAAPAVAGATGAVVFLASVAVAWVLMTRVGTGERPAVPRADGEVAILTVLAAAAVVLPGMTAPASLLAGVGLGLIAAAVDLAADQRREDLLLKLPIGWSLAAAVPAGVVLGRLAARAAGPDPAASTAAGWIAGVLGGAVVIPAGMILVAKARQWLRRALLARSHRGRVAIAGLGLGLTAWIGPGVAVALGVSAGLVLVSRPSPRWSPAISPAAVGLMLLAGFALVALGR